MTIRSTREHLIRLTKFGFISASGLAIDMVIYFYITKAGFAINYSSALGSIFAVTFVFYASKIFLEEKHTSYKKFLIWIVFQILSIVFFSSIVKIFYDIGIGIIESKAFTIPLSFLLNYLVLTFIIKH